jgi:hypothetical protein
MGFQELNPYPAQAGNADVVLAAVAITIGAAGAVSSVSGSPGISAVNAGAGLFTLTYPACVEAIIDPSVQSAAATVVGAMLTARNVSAGTATIRTNNTAGAATNPASGDVLHVNIYAKTSSA